MTEEPEKTVGVREGVVPTVVHRFSGDTQAERTAFWAEQWRAAAVEMEDRARRGDPYAVTRAWVRGRIVDWWRPEVEHLKRTGQLGLALDLAWACMEAAEEATFAHNVDLDTHWAQEAAIVARKMRNFGLEVQICDRVLDIDAFPSDYARERWEARATKARALLERHG